MPIDSPTPPSMQPERIHCDEHGEAFLCVICEHLVDGTGTGFFCDDAETEAGQQWPTAWCADRQQFIDSITDWENAEFWRRLRVVCHHCYERIRDTQLRR